jgi:hypothetical protein
MLNPQRDPDLMDLGRETAGATHLDQCRVAGLSERRLHLLVATGRWQSPFPRVYVTFSGPIPPLTMLYAALLYAGKGSVLSHWTAGALWKLCMSPRKIHITVPYNREVEDQPGIVIHRSRTLFADDIHPSLSPTRTRLERTVLDLLASKRSADEALGLIGDAMRHRATTADRLRAALVARPRTRWRRVILMALPDVAAGAHSVLELKDAAMRRRHGLPMGTRQFTRLADGTEHLDVFVEEWRLHVELDGRLGHDRTREIWRDFRRDNRSEVAKLRHLRYGWSDMIDRPCEIAREQADILRQQGWRGEFRRCPSCPPDL